MEWPLSRQVPAGEGNMMVSVDIDRPLTLEEGDQLAIGINSPYKPYDETWMETEILEITYHAKGRELTGENAISVIDPQTLMNKYLDLITGTAGYYNALIQWRPADYGIKIVAAESLRGFPEATLHGAANDLVDWLYVLGYDYEVDDNTIIFRDRDNFFRPDLTAIELRKDEVKLQDFIVEADDEFTFSSFKIGYDKKDHESANGRFEANNGVFDFSTGYLCGKEKIKELISPYRADAIGMELLCWNRNSRTTDNKSDNDIFFVALVGDAGVYKEYKGIVITDESNGDLKMFNAPFNPYFLVSNNESLIGISTQQLEFTGCEGNRTARITGVSNIYADHSISKKLFESYVYNFVVGSERGLPVDIDRNGLVYIPYEDRMLTGYIKDVGSTPAATKQRTWDIWAYKG